MFGRKRIVEREILSVHIDLGWPDGPSEFYPVGGIARWFRDSLSQRWVRFYVATIDGGGDVCSLVFPAGNVVQVRYKPKPIGKITFPVG